jgi:hypothetical protein
MSQEFIAHKFDLKWLIREIVNSGAYQLAETGDVADAQPQWFQRARVRPLSAEELLESWRVATGYDAWLESSGKKKPEERFYGLTWDYMRMFFGEPNNGVGDFQGGLHEHLYLNNGELGRLMTLEKGSFLESLTKADEPVESRVDRLFLAILSRRPNAEERTRFAEFLTSPDQQQTSEAVREAAWALLTCSEFRFNH